MGNSGGLHPAPFPVCFGEAGGRLDPSPKIDDARPESQTQEILDPSGYVWGFCPGCALVEGSCRGVVILCQGEDPSAATPEPSTIFRFRQLGEVCTVRALMQTPLKSGQGPPVSVGFRRFLVVFLGFPAGFLALPALF